MAARSLTQSSCRDDPEGLYLLQRIRDEAHRFAIAYHRQRRAKSARASALTTFRIGPGPTQVAVAAVRVGEATACGLGGRDRAGARCWSKVG